MAINPHVDHKALSRADKLFKKQKADQADWDRNWIRVPNTPDSGIEIWRSRGKTSTDEKAISPDWYGNGKPGPTPFRFIRGIKRWIINQFRKK